MGMFLLYFSSPLILTRVRMITAVRCAGIFFLSVFHLHPLCHFMIYAAFAGPDSSPVLTLFFSFAELKENVGLRV